MKQKVTLADLSEKTGFSPTTISMILSRKSGVSFSQETINLVRTAAREMGYSSPSRDRLSIFSRSSIMVISPFLSNRYYSLVAQTLRSEAEEADYNVFVYTTRDDRFEEAKILSAIGDSDIGGIVFTLMPRSRGLLKKLSKIAPAVAIADRETGAPFEIIDLYNFRAGELIAEYLSSLNHKHIVCISTPLRSSVCARQLRFEGLRSAWQRLVPDGSLTLFDNYPDSGSCRDNIHVERALGEELASRALEEYGDTFTAFACLNDMLAYGVLDALASANLNVPDDYSVCGCDNDFPSDLQGINLTTVEHYMAHNARLAFGALRAKMRDESPAPLISKKEIRPEIIIRATTGQARRRK
ncbi:MAG: LacI family transcriptional regulator [Desulfovibrio sp.]|nr:LacI family transcriptional regulator [Desulfovibrio sp.]